MGDDKSGTVNGEMAPQEDSAKVLLTERDETFPEVKEAKKCDAKIDIPVEDEFKGLTKEELMKFANEPFWVRLRVFLMFLFWAGWVAMLVLAVLIIIQAPRCEPPPSINWLQQSPMLGVDPDHVDPEEVTSLLGKLGLNSLYMPGLIANHDYTLISPNYVKEKVLALLELLSASNMNAVTDFVPTPVVRYHLWLQGDNFAGIIDPSTRALNYDYNETRVALETVFRQWKANYSVTGFLVPAQELVLYPQLYNLTDELNTLLNPDGIVIGLQTVDLNDTMETLNVPGTYKKFLLDNTAEWNYYKFNPVSAEHRPAAPSQMPPVTLSLMLLPGTPIMQFSSNASAFESMLGPLVRECVTLRTKDAIKFGETQFANTTDDVVAYTRIQKGTPGYAVAVNLGLEEEVLDFTRLEKVPDDGTLVYALSGLQNYTSTKLSLNAVKVAAHEGLVIQFVAKY